MSAKDLSIEEKAAILDWLLTPQAVARADRPARIGRQINRDPLRAHMVFMAWGPVEEVIAAIQLEMKETK